jgi:soluble lytic murein transglycosylase
MLLLTTASLVLAGVAASAGSGAESVAGPAADSVLRERSREILDQPARALRAGREAVEQGDRSHAVWIFGEVMSRHPIVADHAALLRLRVLLQDGDLGPVAEGAREALERYPRSPVRADLYSLLGEALAGIRDDEGARGAWTAALGETRDEEMRAALLLSIAISQERSGLDQQAGLTYKLIWYGHPTSDEARVAGHRLEVLEAFLGKSMRDASDWRRRGDRLFRQRRNDEALAAWDQALTIGLSRSETRRTEKQRAHALFRERRYPEAVRSFGSLPQNEDIPIWHARSLARAGQVPEAIREFEKIASQSRGPLATRAALLAALLLDGRGEDARARRHYMQVARADSSQGLGGAAAWRLGWSAYREGRCEEAIAHFDRLIRSQHSDRIDQLRPRYWRARCLERMGDEAAVGELAGIAGEFPFSYYGWRARSRVPQVAASPTTPVAMPVGRNVLSAADVARARILLEAGLQDAALSELRPLRRRARGLSERLELADLFSEAGDFHAAQATVVDPYVEVLAQGPIAGFEDLWWHAWPAAYSEWVEEATRAPDAVAAELVYSIMREESGYRARIVSPAGARGLLQIMDYTGERLAQSQGRESFDAAELFEPRTNIGLGSFYLAELGRLFPNRLSASIASYNAGPDVVSGWPTSGPEQDDEWVESIPYEQTRSYVKRVLRSLNAYRVLY